MNIAIWYNLPSGGAKRALYEYVRGLKARGHRLEAWCPPTADRSYLPLAELIPEHVLPLEVPRRSSSLIHWLFAASREMKARHEAMFAHCRLCAAAMRDRGFDILFAHCCRSFAVSHMGRFVAMPRVLYLQEPTRRLYEAMPRLCWEAPVFPPGFYWSPRRLKRWLGDAMRLDALRIQVREERRSAECYSRILTNSRYSCESIVRAYGLPARVSRLGIDTDTYRPSVQPPSEPGYILGVGSFNRNKGVQTAIETVALMKDRPSLVWVCNYIDETYLERMKSLALERGVTLKIRSMIDDASLIQFLQRAALLLYPSHLEPLGLAPLEANACGTPVVAVAEGGVRETILDGQNGFLCPRDPALLAAAADRLIADTTLRQAMAQRCVDHVRSHWNLSRMLDEIEWHLAETIHDGRSGSVA